MLKDGRHRPDRRCRPAHRHIVELQRGLEGQRFATAHRAGHQVGRIIGVHQFVQLVAVEEEHQIGVGEPAGAAEDVAEMAKSKDTIECTDNTSGVESPARIR